MLVCFELSMPNVGSWNGKWSGASNYYAVVRQVKELPAKEYYHYSFGDGWAAGVNVKRVDSKEAARIRRKANGFCGYEWMVAAILRDGKIVPSSERKRDEEAAEAIGTKKDRSKK